MTELLLDPSDVSEEGKKEMVQQVSLAAAEQVSVSISCPQWHWAHSKPLFSGQVYIKAVPSSRHENKTQSFKT